MAAGEQGRKGPRVKIKWPVRIKSDRETMEGVTLDLGTDGAFVSCAKPLRLNEVFDLVITAPDHTIEVRAEVIWSNRYGPNDNITPRGMGIRFLQISGEDRKAIAKGALEHLREKNMDPKDLKTLKTLMIDIDQLPGE
jgi:c-di-GMP-binding flagellar brake protein YcgR